MSYNFLVRLRADESGITDLAGNIWNVGSGIKLGTGLLSDTKKSIVFGGDSIQTLYVSEGGGVLSSVRNISKSSR